MSRVAPIAALLALLIPAGCTDYGVRPDPLDPSHDDLDDDGWTVADGDCDDFDAGVNPDAEEVCGDAVDNDCDGEEQGCGLLGLIDLGDADAKFVGEASQDRAGCSVAPAGDVDGDGHDDILLGAYNESSHGRYAGAAYLFYGPRHGVIDVAEADAKWTGAQAWDRAGYAVSKAGDVDGDGRADLLVGAPFEGLGTASRGAVYLIRGPTTGEHSLAQAHAVFRGEERFDQAGASVAPAGDAGGEGTSGWLVGAPRHDGTGEDAGAVYLVTGAPAGSHTLAEAHARLLGEGADDEAGYALAGDTDLDRDGHADLVVGAPGESSVTLFAGAAYVVYGPVEGTVSLAAADAKLTGEAVGDYAGMSVAAAGDVDGDGYADLLVGAYGESSGGAWAGAAYLLYGPVTGAIPLAQADAKLVGEEGWDDVGRALSSAGDANGDGYADLLVGAYGHEAGGFSSGAAYLLYGPVEGTVDVSHADAKLLGEANWDRAGFSVSSAGDVDGDQYDDLLVGTFMESSGGTYAGAAYLLYGGPT